MISNRSAQHEASLRTLQLLYKSFARRVWYILYREATRCFSFLESFIDIFKKASGAQRNPARFPNNITLIHFTHQTVSRSYLGPESQRTLINGGYYFSAEQCAPALCGPSVIVSTLQQPSRPKRIRVRHLKSSKQTAIILSRHPSLVKP